MANATAITLQSAVANGSLEPTAQTLDTGSAAVTIETAATSEMDRILLVVTSTAAANLGVQVNAGEYPPAWRKHLGALTSVTIAQNETHILGPFESARVGQADGKLKVTFTPASGTIAATFYAVKVPKV